MCPQTFPADDLDLELREKRHEKLHGPNSTSYKRNIKLGRVELFQKKV